MKKKCQNATISYLDPSVPNARLVPAQLNAVYGLAKACSKSCLQP